VNLQQIFFKYPTTPKICRYYEIRMSEKWRQSETCIVINDKSQDNTAKYLTFDALLHCKFIAQFVGERIFEISEHLPKL